MNFQYMMDLFDDFKKVKVNLDIDESCNNVLDEDFKQQIQSLLFNNVEICKQKDGIQKFVCSDIKK